MPWQLRRVEERARDMQAAAPLTEIAALCHISVRQLVRAFKSQHGLNRATVFFCPPDGHSEITA